ncbi:MAG: ATP-binding protein [Methanosarcinales archaeon]|nr:MAG: ATP-binding protein [Methanosarcinales archaeon]
MNRDAEAVDAIKVFMSNHIDRESFKPVQLALAQASGTGKTSFARRLSWFLSRRRPADVEKFIWNERMRHKPGTTWDKKKNPVWQAVLNDYLGSPGRARMLLGALQRAVVVDVECPSVATPAVYTPGCPAIVLHELIAKKLGLAAGFVHSSADLVEVMEIVCAACMSLPKPRAVMLIIDEFPRLLLHKDAYTDLMNTLQSLAGVRGLFVVLVGADSLKFLRWIAPTASSAFPKGALALNALSVKDLREYVVASASLPLPEGGGLCYPEWADLCPNGSAAGAATAGAGGAPPRLTSAELDRIVQHLHRVTMGHARILRAFWGALLERLRWGGPRTCDEILNLINTMCSSAFASPASSDDIKNGRSVTLTSEILARAVSSLVASEGTGPKSITGHVAIEATDVKISTIRRIAAALLDADASGENTNEVKFNVGTKELSVRGLCMAVGIPLTSNATSLFALQLGAPMWASCWQMVKGSPAKLSRMVLSETRKHWSTADGDHTAKGPAFEMACMKAVAMKLNQNYKPEDVDVIDTVHALPFLGGVRNLLGGDAAGALRFHCSGTVHVLRHSVEISGSDESRLAFVNTHVTAQTGHLSLPKHQSPITDAFARLARAWLSFVIKCYNASAFGWRSLVDELTKCIRGSADCPSVLVVISTRLAPEMLELFESKREYQQREAFKRHQQVAAAYYTVRVSALVEHQLQHFHGNKLGGKDFQHTYLVILNPLAGCEHSSFVDLFGAGIRDILQKPCLGARSYERSDTPADAH